MRGLLFFIFLLIFAFTFSCDTTQPSFDESIPDIYSLNTEVRPLGGGEIEPSGGDFEAQENLQIEAHPAEGYVFERWEGDLTGNTNPVAILFDADKQITAHFAPRDYPLNIEINGEGSVSEVLISDDSEAENEVSSQAKPSSEDQKPVPNNRDGKHTVQELNNPVTNQMKRDAPEVSSNSSAATVRLTAEPDDGWFFERWEGDLTGSTNPETITVDDEKNVTAVFERENTDGYIVSINVQGEGSVEKEPDRTYFNEGEEVTLTAIAASGWSFIEWQGDLSGSDNSQTVTVEEDLSVTALFEPTDEPAMIIVEQPSGTTAGSAISPAPEVRLIDEFGDPITGAEIEVSLNKNSFTSGSSTASTNGEGIVSFDDLVIETASTGYILTFDVDESGVSDVSSVPFDVVAAAADASNTTANVTGGATGVETVISIRVRDSYGNPVEGAAGELMVEVTGANNANPTVTEMETAGEYAASYTPENAGTDQINIEVTGNPIDGSPFERDVSAADADPGNSSAEVPDGVVGEETVITILIQDSFGNAISGIVDDLLVEVNGANEATPSIDETGTDGEYTTAYTPENPGTDQINIQLYGSHIDGSPFESEVDAAEPDPSNSTADVPDGKVGDETEITITVQDSYGNPISDAAGELSVEISGANNASPTVSETETTGEYTASYTPENTGTDEVDIELDGTSIEGSPFESEIEAADADPSNSSAQVPDGIAGAETEITITVQDRFGNPISNVAGELSVEISGANNASPSVNEEETAGEYSAEYTPENAGDDQISVRLSGEHIGGSPFESEVEAGDADPSNSIADVPNGVTGEETEIRITLRDQYGNSVSGAAGEISVEVSGANSASPSISETGTAGEYTAGYTPVSIGMDQVAISVDDTPIERSPYSSEVDAAEVSGSNSSVTANPEVVKAGENSVIIVELRGNNDRPIGGLSDSDFTLSVDNGSIEGSIDETSTAGTYEFEITNNSIAEVTITVSANGVTLNDTPTVTFEPGDPDNIEIVTQPENTRSGQPINGPPAVRVTDEYGNAIPGVEVHVREASGEQFTIGTLRRTTDESGIATFNDLVIETFVSNFNLVFSTSGLEVTSDNFLVSFIGRSEAEN